VWVHQADPKPDKDPDMRPDKDHRYCRENRGNYYGGHNLIRKNTKSLCGCHFS
jgi:hypothetical protein